MIGHMEGERGGDHVIGHVMEGRNHVMGHVMEGESVGNMWGGEESCDGPCNGEEHIDRLCAGQGEEGHVISYEESQQVM